MRRNYPVCDWGLNVGDPLGNIRSIALDQFTQMAIDQEKFPEVSCARRNPDDDRQ